jgi:hypothetical protein
MLSQLPQPPQPFKVLACLWFFVIIVLLVLPPFCYPAKEEEADKGIEGIPLLFDAIHSCLEQEQTYTA